MATKEELVERIARIETQINEFREDISRIETDVKDFKKEINEYIDNRSREIFQLCLQEYSKNISEGKKSAQAISLSKWQLIFGILGFLGLIVVIILQAMGII